MILLRLYLTWENGPTDAALTGSTTMEITALKIAGGLIVQRK